MKKEYLVLWHWRWDEDGEFKPTRHYDTVEATNAERAISKVRKMHWETESFKRSDMVIDAVLRKGLEYS